MLTAKEAHEMATAYHKNTVQRIKKQIQENIERQAAEGCFWYAWNYDYDEMITTKQRQNIIQFFKDAGYDVKDNVFLETVTIRW